MENTYINTFHISNLHPGPPQDYDNVNFPFLSSLENILHFFFTPMVLKYFEVLADTAHSLSLS